jgi:hypothetical protein
MRLFIIVWFAFSTAAASGAPIEKFVDYGDFTVRTMSNSDVPSQLLLNVESDQFRFISGSLTKMPSDKHGFDDMIRADIRLDTTRPTQTVLPFTDTTLLNASGHNTLTGISYTGGMTLSATLRDFVIAEAVSTTVPYGNPMQRDQWVIRFIGYGDYLGQSSGFATSLTMPTSVPEPDSLGLLGLVMLWNRLRSRRF